METIAVIFGGRSAEHDVSIITALASVIKPLELTKKYNVVAIYISKNGAWYSDPKLKDVNLYSSGKISDFIKKSKPISLSFNGGLAIIQTGKGLAGRRLQTKIDIVFPAMHGTYGEDGSLAGLLDMAGVAYVGCGLAASAVAMDKILAKQVAETNGIKVTKYLALTKVDIEEDLLTSIKKIEQQLSYPLFVKPAHLGSSIGISRVANSNELRNGLEVAAHYDQRVIIEEAVNNLIEVTLPIIGNKIPLPALLERPITKSEEFFDFETKYLRGGKKGKSGKSTKGAQGYSQLPAELPKSLSDKAIETGMAVYRVLGLSGISRVDMLIDQKTEIVYFNEVNPLPGSLYHHNWNKAGISNVDLVERLVGYAKDRHQARVDLDTSFTTNFLQQF
ncbi:MAG: D-alanine--D-alanine ligase family protein [Candidatus Saccharimonadales bacterium]